MPFVWSLSLNVAGWVRVMYKMTEWDWGRWWVISIGDRRPISGVLFHTDPGHGHCGGQWVEVKQGVLSRDLPDLLDIHGRSSKLCFVETASRLCYWYPCPHKQKTFPLLPSSLRFSNVVKFCIQTPVSDKQDGFPETIRVEMLWLFRNSNLKGLIESPAQSTRTDVLTKHFTR